MFVKLGLSLLCFLLFGATDDCGSKSGGAKADANASPPAAPAKAAPDAAVAAQPAPSADRGACALIENSEVAALQGSEVRGAQASASAGNGFVVSQCFYTVISADGTKNLSVHLEVTRNDPAAPDTDALAHMWREKFQQARDKKKSDKPRPVEGVGREAYWVGNDKIGALYAMTGDVIVRVSVGGPDEAGAKMEKSKRLAEKALARI